MLRGVRSTKEIFEILSQRLFEKLSFFLIAGFQSKKVSLLSSSTASALELSYRRVELLLELDSLRLKRNLLHLNASLSVSKQLHSDHTISSSTNF